MRWRQLSDAEVRARLIQRGVDEDFARFLVRKREDERAARNIDRFLGRDD